MIRGPTVGEALDQFRRSHGLASDESARPWWTCRLGPVTLRLPNWHWRRRAILAHDLHHLLTGIPCTLRGECQMAAWEFGAGPMPHWGAALFCVPLVLVGLGWAPRRIWQAFLAGRRSRSLHRSGATDRLLALPLQVARTGFAVPANAPGGLADRARFAVILLQAAVIVAAPIAGLVACGVVLAI